MSQRIVAGVAAALLMVGGVIVHPAPAAAAGCPSTGGTHTAMPADEPPPVCHEVMFSDTYFSQQECDAAGQQLQDQNPDVVTWRCQANVKGQFTLFLYVCERVNGVDYGETWIDLHSRMYLDVSNESQDNGATVHQWTYTGAANQWWLRVRTLEGYFRVISLNSGKCLGVLGASMGNGTQIVQWDCNDSEDQQWAYRQVGSLPTGWPIYNLVNRNSGKCLGIIGGSTDVGGNAVQWSCNGQEDQEWY